MGYDIVTGLSGAIGGATPKSSDDSPSRVRKNKTPDLPIPESYGGSGPETGDKYKRGGKVKRTGKAQVHKGERVLTAKQARKYEKKRGKK